MAKRRGAREAGYGRYLRSLVESYRWRLALLACIAFMGALLESSLLVVITSVATALVAGNSAVGPVLGISITIGIALLVGVALLVGRLALSLTNVVVSNNLSARVTADQRSTLAHAYLSSSWEVQQAEPPGKLQEILTSFVLRVNLTVQAVTTALTASLSLLAFLCISLFIDPGATLAVVVVLTVVGGALFPLRRAIKRFSARWRKADLEFASAVSELGALGREMQTFGVRDEFTRRIDRLTSETTTTQKHAQMIVGAQSPLYMAMAYASLLAGVALLGSSESRNMATVGAVLLLMLRSLSYGQSLSSAAASLTAYAPFLEKVHETADFYEANPSVSGTLKPAGSTPVIARSVGFTYPNARPALTNVSFTLNRGEIVGVIGPSGAGKSTFAQVLLGLREPTAGTITVGGVDLFEVDRSWWTARTTFVPQDAQLMTGTVAENIRFCRSGLSDDEVRRAAAQANLMDDIADLPDGFDTHLGARGNELSGGQRQRLSIARALVGSPDLLIMDEPTSSLDSRSEQLICDALERLRGQMTVLLIAHRMSTLGVCDRIMVIEDGTLTAIGTPAELRDSSEFFRHAMATTAGPRAGFAERATGLIGINSEATAPAEL